MGRKKWVGHSRRKFTGRITVRCNVCHERGATSKNRLALTGGSIPCAVPGCTGRAKPMGGK